MLFKHDELYLIDPILDTFGCTELDVAKFIASLYINQYDDMTCLAMRALCAYNNFDEEDINILVKSEIIRVYKYHPDKQFILNKVQQAEADFWRIKRNYLKTLRSDLHVPPLTYFTQGIL